MENIIEGRLELNKNIPAPLTQEERRTKLRAQLIRKKFERATDTVKQILASMSDQQLVEREAAHHAVKIGAIAAQHADRKRKQ